MTHTKYIHDYHVRYDDDQHHIDGGIYYLDDTLSREEAKVFFDAARHDGEAQFRDSDGHKFTLMHQHKDNESVYTLIATT